MPLIIPKEANEIWKEIMNDGKENWICMSYAEGKMEELKILGKGNGGLLEFLKCFNEQEVVIFGGLRVYGYKSDLSKKTTKFIKITFVPPQVRGLRKARAAMHMGEVCRFFRFYHLPMSIVSIKEASEEILEQKLGILSREIDGIK